MKVLIAENIGTQEHSTLFFKLRDAGFEVYGASSGVEYDEEESKLYIELYSDSIRNFVLPKIHGKNYVIKDTKPTPLYKYIEGLKAENERLAAIALASKNALPINFITHPSDSVVRKHEAEVIAQNIMLILKRTGNKFRKLGWEEYKEEREKDGGFSESEKGWFDTVLPYTVSGEKANEFTKDWYKDVSSYKKDLEAYKEILAAEESVAAATRRRIKHIDVIIKEMEIAQT